MSRKALFIAALLATIQAMAGEFAFCPAGFFADEEDNCQFDARPYSGDHYLNLPDETHIQFAGPIFPGYKLAPKGDVEIAANSMTARQHCKEFNADITKTFTLVNGGILSEISFKREGEPLKTPPTFRIFLPVGVFAGKNARCGGKDFKLPAEKSQDYTLAQGKNAEEFRFQISDKLELGIKLLEGVAYYRVADCRHHGKPEPHFHLSLSMAGNSLKYFVCLLKPGQPFPSTTPAEKTAAPVEKGNLLGEGSGFEVGPRNMNPASMISWSEAWTKPAPQPQFDPEAAKDGKFSLKLTACDNKQLKGRFNLNRVLFKPLKLDPDKTYTLSAWLKTDVDKLNACLDCKENGIWDGAGGKITPVTKDWTRYTYTFQPKKFQQLNYCIPLISIHPNVKEGHLWIDDVQLEEATTPSAYTPEPVEFGAVLEEPHKLVKSSALAKTSLKALFRNNLDKEVECPVDYVVKNYWDEPVLRGTIDAKIPAKGNLEKDIQLAGLPCGYYRAYFDGKDGKHHDEVIFGVYEPMKYGGKLPMNWPLANNDAEGNQITRDLGFGTSRSWDFTFKRTCPEEGKFNFEETDAIVEANRKAHLNLMPILGHALFQGKKETEWDNIPKWAVDKECKSSNKTSWANSVRFPKIDAWKTYVKTLVGRYKDDIHAWELMNEPNCWITPEEYAVYLKATYEAAKEADPKCVVIGGCATSDWGGEPAPWTKRLLEIDKGKSMDALSIHMYSNCSPETSMRGGSDKFLSYLQEETAKYGKRMDIWHTEKSHNTTNTGYSLAKVGLPGVYMQEPGFRVPNFRAKAEFLIRETLIDSSIGKGPYFWFGATPSDIYIMSRYPYGLHHMEFDGAPCPELLAANGLARMLEGRNEPRKLLKLGKTNYCALFDGPEGALAALWSSEGKATLSLPSDTPKYTLCNFFGAPMPQSGKIELATTPVYLRFDKINADQAENFIQQGETDGPKAELSGSLELENAKLALAVYAQNLTGKEISEAVKIAAPPAGWSFQGKDLSLKAQPERFGRVAFPVETLKSSNDAQTVGVSGAGASAKLEIQPFKSETLLKDVLSDSTEAQAFQATPKIDGDLSDWSDDGLCGAATAPKVKLGRELWKGPLDLSCEMRFRWNEKNLYVAAIVYDDKVERFEPAASAYASDCLELFLGLEPGTRGKAQIAKELFTLGDYDFQLLLAPGMEEGSFKQATGWNAKRKSDAGIEIVSKRIKYGYCLEAAIAWSNLKEGFKPEKGRKILMTFQVKDTDGKGQPVSKCIYWSGNDGNWMSPKNWGTLELK